MTEEEEPVYGHALCSANFRECVRPWAIRRWPGRRVAAPALVVLDERDRIPRTLSVKAGELA